MIRSDQLRQGIRYNAKRAKSQKYLPGDLVMVERVPAATGQSLKLAEKYKGPYVITEVLPHDRYRVEDLPGLQNTQRFYSNTVPIDKIKRWELFEAETAGELEADSDDERGEDPSDLKEVSTNIDALDSKGNHEDEDHGDVGDVRLDDGEKETTASNRQTVRKQPLRNRRRPKRYED